MVDTSREQDPVDARPASLGQMFFDRVEATPDHVAYLRPAPSDGDPWLPLTWAETAERVSRIAAGLVALGIEPEQRVAIASSTRLEWVLADLAILSAGAATTTVYPSTIAPDAVFILANSGSRVVFAEDADQLAKVADNRADLPDIRAIVLFDGSAPEQPTDSSAEVITLAELESRGAALLVEQPDAVRRRVAATRPEHLATLIYTSGTTGRPKGVRLSHAAWTYEGASVQALDILSIDDVQYLWLPLAHAFGKVLLAAQLGVGFATAVDGRVDKIVDNLAIVRPTFMGAAPRIFEKAHGRIVTMMEGEGGLRKRMFDMAFAVALKADRLAAAGQPVPRLLALRRQLFDKLVFSKIRARFGGRIRFFVSGAAALNPELAAWFHAAGILILEGYGLTESSAGTCVNLPGRHRFGTVGPPFPGSEVTIADDGELLIRGPGVMDGYHDDPGATADAVQDGWLHTGDIGEVDADGFVRVTDRKKDLFKTSAGKYVAPAVIEGHFMAVCPYASQFVVFGAERNFVSALVTLDPDAIVEWAERNGLAGAAYDEIARSPATVAMVQGYVDEVNSRLNRWETVKRFVVLERDLSIESGEITPSLKVRRRSVEERYRDRLDALYT